MLKFEKQKQKQLSTIVTTSFSLADGFSLNPPFRIFKQERFSTQIGKMASMSLLIIFLIQFAVALQGVLHYDQVNVVSKQVVVHSSQPMYFAPNNFTLALFFMSINQGPMSNIQSFLNITIQNCQILRTFNPNGTLNKITREYKLTYFRCFDYPIQQCSLTNHFPTQVQQSMFISKNLSQIYCMDSDVWKNRSIVLQGTSTDEKYQYVSIIATICENSTNSQKCASQSDIQKKLSLVQYGFYYNDILTQMDSIDQPFSPLITVTTTTVSYLQTKSILHNNQIQQIQSDIGYILENIVEQSEVSIQSIQPSNDPYNGQYVLWHLIQQYNILMNHKRTYQKVQTILGQLGGLWQLMYYAVLLIINPIVSMNMNMALANKLFSFSSEGDPTKKSTDPVKSQPMNKSIFIQPQIQKLDINNDNELTKFLKIKKSSLQIGIDMILLQLCGCKRLEKRQLDYAKQKILNKLDVSYILTKLIEIDKLKQILLTKDQRHLFNHLSKPTIPFALFNADQRIAIEDDPKHEIILQEEKSDLMKFKDAFAAYQNIIIKSGQQLSLIDQKLIHQLDTDIYNIFKQIEQEGEDLQSSNAFRRPLVLSMTSQDDYLYEFGNYIKWK